MDKPPSLLLSCEHGGHRIPAAYRHLFKGEHKLIRSHLGFDAGALASARALSSRLNAPLFFSEISRLVVDLNRSLVHKHVFSEMTLKLPEERREELVEAIYRPYRENIEQAVLKAVSGGALVVHLSVHSFVPFYDGMERKTDLGFLYDPERIRERSVCTRWRQGLSAREPGLRMRMNYPYLGKADGLTTWLRRRFKPGEYLGLELELNQKLLGSVKQRAKQAMLANIADSLVGALGNPAVRLL